LKTGAFILFLLVVITIYALVNTYIFSRALQAIPAGSPYRTWFIIGFWLVASAFVLARFLERAYPCNFTEVITWIGSLWLGAMAYFFFAIVLIDLGRLLNSLFHIFPSAFYVNYEKTKLIALGVTVCIVFITVLAGFINARLPRIKNLDITIPKTVSGDKTMKIVMASDIHMGTLIAKRRTNWLVNRINSLEPDLILLAGDVVDEDLKPVIRRNLGETLSTLKARLGVYGITGNHEYIGGVEEACRYLTEHGVKMLRDTSVLVDNRLYLVGREDRDKPRFTGKPRKSLEEVMQPVDRSYPVLLMDHQPFRLEQAARQGVDLEVSGHTHHGQLWPFNYITKAIYELSWGYKKIGGTNYYVSSGFGSWGPPIRLGNRPEIVVITLRFN
jgi:uncharacterized protein